MKSREEVIAYCKGLEHVYEDYPFHDVNWTVMRCEGNKKTFALIYEREGIIWVNVKVDPEWGVFWRGVYPSVIPAYHMNKVHWNTIMLDGSIPTEEIQRMIRESYELVCPKKKATRNKSNG